MNKILVIALLAFGIACASNSARQEENNDENKPKLSRRDQIRLGQYQVQGMELYKKYCSMCHQDSGEGLASLYPPLKNSDYLMEDLERAACIIKNGMVETITVNGKTYSQMMPALPQLTPLEVAEILTYITNAWGNEAGISGVKEVEKWLKAC